MTKRKSKNKVKFFLSILFLKNWKLYFCLRASIKIKIETNTNEIILIKKVFFEYLDVVETKILMKTTEEKKILNKLFLITFSIIEKFRIFEK